MLRRLIEAGDLGDLYYLYAQRVNLGIVRQDENALWSLAPHDISVILHLLDQEDRLDQIDFMREMSVGEAARLRDLRDNGTNEGFADWLSFEIDQLENRIAWLDRRADA